MKRIAIIGTVGIPAQYGGFETLCEHLVEELPEKFQVSVYCSGKKYKKADRLTTYKNTKLHYIPLDANGVQSIPYDTWSILHALWRNDILLILGVAGAWILPFVYWFTHKKIIVSIDGIEWKREKWNLAAKLYLWWAEKIAVRYSHIDISDNESIQDYTALRYGTLSKVIEYGADHTRELPLSEALKKKYPVLEGEYAFKVCRIEPENNVHLILEAFKTHKSLPLVLVGNWNKSEYGRNLKAKYHQDENIHLLDPIYDQNTLDQIRGNCAVYVHGHSAGGTNPSLVEAMYLGRPILAFDVSYNRTTTENQAIYFSGLQELTKHLKTPLSQMKGVGQRMRRIAERRYTWNKIAAKYERMFEEVQEENKEEISHTSFEQEPALQDVYALHLTHSQYFYHRKNFIDPLNPSL